MSAMNDRRPVADFLDLPSPCEVSWDEMDGDVEVRHCARCKHEVRDLSVLSAAEVTELLESTRWGVCVSFLVDRDGNMVTRDTRELAPPALPPTTPAFGRPRARAPRRLRTITALAASAGLGLITGCSTRSETGASPVASAQPIDASPAASAAPIAAPSASAVELPAAPADAAPLSTVAPAASASAAVCHDPKYRRTGGAPRAVRRDPGIKLR
jgi:hypothetical protein